MAVLYILLFSEIKIWVVNVFSKERIMDVYDEEIWIA